MLLFSFNSCRILSKTKTENLEKQNTEIEGFEKNSGSTKIISESKEKESLNYDLLNAKKFDFLNVNYEPTFDSNGAVLPLVFKHTINGVTEEIYLSGGSLKKENTADQSSKSENSHKNIESKSVKDTTFYIHTTYKTRMTYKSRIVDKKKDMTSFDFNVWIYLFVFLLIVTRLGFDVYGFYKKPQSKLQNFINRIFNDKG